MLCVLCPAMQPCPPNTVTPDQVTSPYPAQESLLLTSSDQCATKPGYGWEDDSAMECAIGFWAAGGCRRFWHGHGSRSLLAGPAQAGQVTACKSTASADMLSNASNARNQLGFKLLAAFCTESHIMWRPVVCCKHITCDTLQCAASISVQLSAVAVCCRLRQPAVHEVWRRTDNRKQAVHTPN
jgi:hypothetical protein